ncbi:MAG TPA: SDR family oxidoreductase [Sphingobium sp.]|uniref:SDR family oxidoreductase n=1 Tax=Sphingobium sp. TaxID=1912891 RepID=UPI002ED1F877
MELKDKVAFITGGGGGIGEGMAQAFIEKDMRVVLADMDLLHAEEAAARLGDRAIPLAMDVTSLDSWATARETVLTRFGQVDILCNNAGISSERMPLDQFPPEAFAKVMAVNVTGVYNGIATFGAEMRERGGGHIVNTSSVNGLTPFGTFAAYSASKFAVLAMSDAVRQEMAPYGVGVSTLFPGLTRSRMSLDPKGGADKGKIDRAALEANMMQPIWLGRAVVRAIERNEPYIITHPDYRPALEARFRDILDAFGGPAQPGYKTGASATM